jgi:hypothetical protein
MDRLIHTALNSLANLRDTRITSAQKLSGKAPGRSKMKLLGASSRMVLRESGDFSGL